MKKASAMEPFLFVSSLGHLSESEFTGLKNLQNF
nr:hypothetical protein [Mucilaginibacter sp. X4EP1]